MIDMKIVIIQVIVEVLPHLIVRFARRITMAVIVVPILLVALAVLRSTVLLMVLHIA
jgi:hypothetical protein